MNKYEIIYADPAWQYKTKESLAKKSILNGEINSHYKTMTIDELEQLPIDDISDKNCMLFLWVVSHMLDDGIDLMKKWGFKYSTIAFIWHKQRTNPGHYTMSECEICIVGRRGKIPTPRGARNIRQFLSEMRGKHSAKPNEIRKRIELLFPTQNKIELFAREKNEGWHVWGNEVESDITLMAAIADKEGGKEKTIKTGKQHKPTNEVQTKPCNIYGVSNSVCPNCGEPRPPHYQGEGSCESCAQ